MHPGDIAALAVIALQVGDFVTTRLNMKAGLAEDNDNLVRFDGWLKQFTGGRWTWLAISKGAIIAVGAVGIYAGWFHSLEAAGILALLAAYYAHICWSNFKLYRAIA